MNERVLLDTNWQDPSHIPTLEGDRVHVWRANLDLSTEQIESLSEILSTDELARAKKFRFPRHRRRFIAARATLRQLLGNYLQTKPSKVAFAYSDRGKPFLADSHEDSCLQFNVSHSQEYALIGFTFNRLIGVDVEYLRPMPDAEQIAQRFFTAREFSLVQNAALKDRLFFQLWTAKEAYLKAIGTGLSGMLDRVEITLDPTQVLLLIGQDRVAAANWSLYFCTPATDYLAAIAVETPLSSPQIDFWHWDTKCS